MLRFGSILALCFALTGCSGESPPPSEPTPPAESTAPAEQDEHHGQPAQQPVAVAHAELAPTDGSDVQGLLAFTVTNGAVQLTGTVSGLEPNREHGFHIHEFGDCSAPDAMSAGGHWNPLGHDHGRRSHGEFHAGDMDNLRADASGQANVDDLLAGLEIGTGSALDIVGKSVIVHIGTDDYVSQPTGDAGGRAACGVIEVHRD
jgi:Cu-Zn family superoxide dismutase